MLLNILRLYNHITYWFFSQNMWLLKGYGNLNVRCNFAISPVKVWKWILTASCVLYFTVSSLCIQWNCADDRLIRIIIRKKRAVWCYSSAGWRYYSSATKMICCFPECYHIKRFNGCIRCHWLGLWAFTVNCGKARTLTVGWMCMYCSLMGTERSTRQNNILMLHLKHLISYVRKNTVNDMPN